MTVALLPKQEKHEIGNFNPDQVSIIKNTLCKGINDDELKLFLAVCNKTGLDPFMKQIYAIKIPGRDGAKMTIQTSIDGYRLIAERTGRYCPGRKSTFEYKDGKVFSATSYIKKQTVDGTWHEVEESAYYSEYVPPITKNGYENPFWRDKPHIMLAKCAEALALRKAFPNELSSIYTKEEMDQANTPLNQPTAKPDPLDAFISDEEYQELNGYFDKCPPASQELFNGWLKSKQLNSLANLTKRSYEAVKQSLMGQMQESKPAIEEEVPF